MKSFAVLLFTTTLLAAKAVFAVSNMKITCAEAADSKLIVCEEGTAPAVDAVCWTKAGTHKCTAELCCVLELEEDQPEEVAAATTTEAAATTTEEAATTAADTTQATMEASDPTTEPETAEDTATAPAEMVVTAGVPVKVDDCTTVSGFNKKTTGANGDSTSAEKLSLLSDGNIQCNADVVIAGTAEAKAVATGMETVVEDDSVIACADWVVWADSTELVKPCYATMKVCYPSLGEPKCSAAVCCSPVDLGVSAPLG